ncbi:hypothetical protein PR202_ga07890 [Eleusine coracana subsp. coracana]|uniref:Reverse transcriptase zinc-binding domain-containing protein n=1 Tax=Eleusine coracana subsp. coracana TaxID=191504 RepID=A0AAV5BYQ9_ELECO|nr:hypothetical protein PR202_ga07890 [Eleusine coracana subsp. coracana]
MNRRGPSLLTRVSELLDPVTRTWDEDLVKDTFWEQDTNTILSLSMDADLDDWPAWHFDAKGAFSVRSAYKVAVRKREHDNAKDVGGSGVVEEGETNFDWRRIWRLEVPNKVRMFVWRFVHNNLAVGKNIARRGVKWETICPMCNRLDEDGGHLFLKCKAVKECWRLTNLEDVRVRLTNCRTSKETITEIWRLEADTQLKVWVLLWRWWSARNKVNARERTAYGAEIYSDIIYYINEFSKLKKAAGTGGGGGGAVAKWEGPPPEDMYKINIDASYSDRTHAGGWGFVARVETS